MNRYQDSSLKITAGISAGDGQPVVLWKEDDESELLLTADQADRAAVMLQRAAAQARSIAAEIAARAGALACIIANPGGRA